MVRIRFAALGAVLVIASATAGAQAPQDNRAAAEGRGVRGGHAGRNQGRNEKALLKGISLSESQKSQIKQIRTKYRDQFKAQGEQGDSARDKGREQMQQARAQQLSEIRGVLTVDQRVQFDSNVAELKARMGDNAQGQGGGKGKQGGRGSRGR